MNCRSIKRALIRAGGWEGHKPLETATMLSKGMEARGIQTEIENHWEILADAKALRDADSHYEERVCPMPVAWVKKWGNGRVFYSALGHAPSEFNEFSHALELTLRGFQWTG